MVEISSLDEDRIMKVYALMEQLHAEEKADELEEEKRNDERANSILVTNDIKGSLPSEQQPQSPQPQSSISGTPSFPGDAQ